MSIGLAIIGNPGAGPHTALRLLHELRARVDAARDALQYHTDGAALLAQQLLREASQIALTLEQRERRMSVHGNAPRRNPGRGQVMSDSVQAIVYVHKDDGEFYIHPFGGKDASDRDLALLSRMGCFTKRSRVRMVAEPDGSLSVEGMDGQNLWKEF